MASSADGTRLAAVSYGSGIYLSTNSGGSWFNSGAPGANWDMVAASADGNKLLAVVEYGNAYIWQATPAPVLSLARSGANLALSWTVPSATFELQQGRDLTGAGWVTVTNPPTLNPTNLQYQMTLSPSNSSAFYRLAFPPGPRSTPR